MSNLDISSFFIPKYIGNIRTCDGPYCKIQQHLHLYNSSIGDNLCYCDYHNKDPYNMVEVLPTNKLKVYPRHKFNQEYYQLFDIGNNLICAYVGCLKNHKLSAFQDYYYCTEHMRIMTDLHLKCISNSRFLYRLLNLKYDEFNCKKIMSPETLSELYNLENILQVDKNFFSRLAINLVHKAYLLKNHQEYQQYKLDHPNLRSSSPLPSQLNKSWGVPFGGIFDSGASSSTEGSPNGSPTVSPTGSPIVSPKSKQASSVNKTKSFIKVSLGNYQRSVSPPPGFEVNGIIKQNKSTDLFVPKLDLNNSDSYFIIDPADFLRNPNYYYADALRGKYSIDHTDVVRLSGNVY